VTGEKAEAGGPDRIAREGRMAILIGLTVLGVLAVGLLPTILAEGTRDWIAYQQAADRLAAGQPLYVFVLATPDDEYYLYPPLGAALWRLAGSPEALLVLKIAALCLCGALALVAAPVAIRRDRLIIGACIVAAALVAPADIHDLILANVMALYVGAVALSLSRPGWLGASALGIVCAAALKPVIGPYLLWLLIRRRSDFGRVAAVGIVASVACALVIGPQRYVEYLTALPRMSVLTDLPSGNAGLSRFSREIALVGVATAYIVTVLASLRLTPWRSAAVAIGAGLLAQPALGFNYAGLLLPAVVSLWAADRPAGLAAIGFTPILALVSPPLAGAFVIAAAFRESIWRRFRTSPRPVSVPA
jgi:hypothetical protein